MGCFKQYEWKWFYVNVKQKVMLKTPFYEIGVQIKTKIKIPKTYYK